MANYKNKTFSAKKFPTCCLLLLLLFGFNSANAQSFKKSLRKARHFTELADFLKAKENYKLALAKDSLDKTANYEMGMLLLESLNNPEESGKYFINAEKYSGKDTSYELIYGLGRYYHFIGAYQKAINYYNRMFAFIEDNNDGKLIKNEMNQNISDCEFALKNSTITTTNRQRLKVENLGPEINTPYAEYTPVIDKNETVLLFTSRRKNNVGHRTDSDDLYYEDMYIARKNSSGKFAGAHQLTSTDNEMKLLKNTRFNESFISISHDGTKLYTYRDNSIYESVLTNGIWSEPIKMDENINPYTYQNHASISSDAKTIYFTSNKKGGYGELDIYKSVKGADGKWSAPENLGPQINTTGDEESPEISEDGKTLYFASKVLPGYGGFDLFKTTFDGTSWSKPENLGTPINSEGDDLFLNMNDKGTKGYFASGRKGGLGDLDLYKISLLDRFSDAELYTNKDHNQQILFSYADTSYVGDTVKFDASKSMIKDDKITNFSWQVADSTQASDSAILVYNFKYPGTYMVKFLTVTTSDKAYYSAKNIVILPQSMKKTNSSETTLDITGTKTNTNTSSPDNTNIKLESVFFDYNKSDLRPDAVEAITKNLEKLKTNKTITINIAAHCDSRGTEQYNKMLSEKRAKAVINFLERKGFKRNRIKAVMALGKSQPTGKCLDDANCTEQENQLNRFVEFIVQ